MRLPLWPVVFWLLVFLVLTRSELLADPLGGPRALIQERGTLLPPGRLTGGAQVPLERAEGGDTPVLTFRSDRGLVRLLLDTGAASAMVTPVLVKRLGLESRSLSPEEFSLAGGGETCSHLALSKTRLPELRITAGSINRPFLRLQGMEAFVLPVVALPQGIDGVLGAAALQQLPFVVDPPNERLLIGGAALQWRQRMLNRAEIIPLTWRRGVPLAGIQVLSHPDGKIRQYDALVDTGAEGLFLTPEVAAVLRPLGRGQPARLAGVCGLQQVRRQRLMGIGMGWQAPPIQTHEAIITTNPVFPLLGVEAIVGQEVLRFRRQLWRLDTDPPRLELW